MLARRNGCRQQERVARPELRSTGRRMTMKRRMRWIVSAMTLLVMADFAMAQQAAPAAGSSQTAATASAAPDMTPVANPVSTAVKAQLPRFSKNMVAAAEAMPAEKYSFKPTPEMNSFGHLVMHIAQSNNGLCAKASGMAA